MNADAARIRDAMQAVARLRLHRAGHIPLGTACLDIKRFQAQRFRLTYADLLRNTRYRAASGFFLDELYGDRDYARRDQQFSRIADSIARLFPESVVMTAAALAEVHALTERLDDLMARQWLVTTASNPASRYIDCWRAVGQQAERRRQLEVVLQLGQELDRLTHQRGLRSLLKMMRLPAAAAGLGALQSVLESGFDAFGRMKGANEFLAIIEERETAWMKSLFDENAVTCETRLRLLLDSDLSN